MLRAVLNDFCAWGAHAITVTRDPRLEALPHPVHIIPVNDEPWALWQHCVAAADAVLAIAPETDGVLERFNRMVEQSGKLLLGCTPAAVVLTGSKIATVQALARHGMAVPETMYWGQQLPEGGRGYVVKPDDGAGSEDTYFFEHARALSAWQPPDSGRAWIVQSYIPGRAMSLALLCGHGQVRVLAVNEQLQMREGRSLRQSGMMINAHPDQRAVMQSFSDRLHGLLPGLRGFVGVDYIETSAGPVVLEINPRLTTSYVAMSDSLGVNAACLIMGACLGEAEAMTCTLAARPVRIEMSQHA